LSAFQMDSEANRHICIYLNSTQIRSLNEPES
jgi:hypothetical protein